MVATAAMGSTMCISAGEGIAAVLVVPEVIAAGAAITTGVRTVSKPGSDTTSVKLPACGATS